MPFGTIAIVFVVAFCGLMYMAAQANISIASAIINKF